MRIIWTTILYNEEKTIERTIDSIKDVIDEAFIGIDRKTTDNTLMKVCGLLSKYNIPNFITNFDFWDNYSLARNHIMDSVILDPNEKDYTYWLIIDGDEHLDPTSIPIIKKLKKNTNISFDAIMSRQTGNDVDGQYSVTAPTVRIFKTKYRYKYRAHEVPNISSDKCADIKEIIMYNDKTKEDRKTDNTSKLIKLLELDLKEHNLPSMMFNLAYEYGANKQYKKSRDLFYDAIINKIPESMRYMAYLKVATASHHLNDEKEELKTLEALCKAFPKYNNHLIFLGVYYLNRKQVFEAFTFLFQAAAMSQPIDPVMMFSHHYTWVPWYLISKGCQLIGWREGWNMCYTIIKDQWPKAINKMENVKWQKEK